MMPRMVPVLTPVMEEKQEQRILSFSSTSSSSRPLTRTLSLSTPFTPGPTKLRRYKSVGRFHPLSSSTPLEETTRVHPLSSSAPLKEERNRLHLISSNPLEETTKVHPLPSSAPLEEITRTSQPRLAPCLLPTTLPQTTSSPSIHTPSSPSSPSTSPNTSTEPLPRRKPSPLRRSEIFS